MSEETMSPSTDPAIAGEDRRAPDQEAATEAAFEAGTLPEADRRVEAVGAVASLVTEVAPANSKLDEVMSIVESVVDVFEWFRRGDGTHVLYKNGQITGDHDEIQANPHTPGVS